MRFLRFAFAFALGLSVFGPGISPAWSSEFVLFRNIWGDVLVSTDTTAAGHALTPPDRENPIYYLGQSLGCRLGSISGDKLPKEEELNLYVAKILAKQGYLSAKPGGHEPTLFLVVQWGYLEPGSGDLLWFLGYDAKQDIASPSPSGILGPEVYLRNFRSRATETILENARGAIYGIIVTAFDYKSASTTKPIAYWQTRIGLPAVGKSMAQALPTMLLAASSAIGRESNSPVLASADDARAGKIKLGELQILDMSHESLRGSDSATKH